MTGDSGGSRELEETGPELGAGLETGRWKQGGLEGAAQGEECGRASLRSRRSREAGGASGVWSAGLRSGQEEGLRVAGFLCSPWAGGSHVLLHARGTPGSSGHWMREDRKGEDSVPPRPAPSCRAASEGSWGRERGGLCGHSEDRVQGEMGARDPPPALSRLPPSCLLPAPQGSMRLHVSPCQTPLLPGGRLHPEPRGCPGRLPLHAPRVHMLWSAPRKGWLVLWGVREGAGDTWAFGPIPSGAGWPGRAGGQVRRTAGFGLWPSVRRQGPAPSPTRRPKGRRQQPGEHSRLTSNPRGLLPASEIP